MTPVAPSVRAALAEANRVAPGRSTVSDGAVGDAKHARRESDHNPGARGLVHACDITHDPGNGFDCSERAEQIRRRCQDGLERRVAYVIWNRRIFSSRALWTWRTYDGSNPHDKHMHISIRETEAAENDLSPWWPQVTAPKEEAVVALDLVGVLDVDAAPDDKGRAPFWGVDARGNVYAVNGAPFLGSLASVGVVLPAGVNVVGICHRHDRGGYVLLCDDVHQEPDGSWNASTYAFPAG